MPDRYQLTAPKSLKFFQEITGEIIGRPVSKHPHIIVTVHPIDTDRPLNVSIYRSAITNEKTAPILKQLMALESTPPGELPSLEETRVIIVKVCNWVLSQVPFPDNIEIIPMKYADMDMVMQVVKDTEMTNHGQTLH